MHFNISKRSNSFSLSLSRFFCCTARINIAIQFFTYLNIIRAEVYLTRQMKLDNIDLAQLQVEQLPKFDKCPCELCDDGCFDRAGYQHHPECRRKLSQKSKLSQNIRCPLTHYQSTFLSTVSPSGQPEDHRRHPCPPPRDNDIPISFKNVPMDKLSSQRDHYQAPPPGALKKSTDAPVRQVDNLVIKRTVPMDTKTQYQVEYVEKPVVPVVLRPLKESK